MNRFVLILIIIAIGCVLWAIPNEHVIRAANNLKWEAMYAETPDGGFIALWGDACDGSFDVVVQRFSPSGLSLWPQPVRVDNCDSMFVEPVITRTVNDEYVVVWQQAIMNQPGHIKAQKLNLDGQTLWQDGGIELFSGDYSISSISTTANSSGGVYVVCTFMSYTSFTMAISVDSDSQVLWPQSGILLAESEYIHRVTSAVMDNQGALIVAVNGYYNSAMVNTLYRIDQDGEILSSNLVQLDDYGMNHPGKLALLPNGNICMYTVETVIRLLVFNENGILITPQSILVSSDVQSLSWRQANMELLSDGAMLFAWHGVSNAKVHVQKVSAQFQLLWSINSPGFGNLQSNQEFISISPATDGGAWVAWSENYLNPRTGVTKLQRINPDGTVAWAQAGLILSADAFYTLNPLVRTTPQGCLVLWQNCEQTSLYLRIQTVSETGSLGYPAGGSSLVEAIVGSAWVIESVMSGNNLLTVWMDERYFGSGSVIYYQLFDPQFNALLEENGRKLIETNTAIYGDPVVIGLDNGSVAVVFVGDTNLYYQLIDSNGNKVYPEPGIVVAVSPVNFKASKSGNDVYIYWGSWDSSAIMGQRFTNGLGVWGQGGQQIVSFLEPNFIIDFWAVGRYLVLYNHHSWSSTYSLRTLLLNEDGSYAAGWEDGSTILVYPQSYIISLYDCGLNGDDLVVVYRVRRDESELRINKRSHINQAVWGDEGVLVYGTHAGVGLFQSQIGNGRNYLVFATGTGQARVQAVDYAGNKLMGEDGAQLNTQPHQYFEIQFYPNSNGWLTMVMTAPGIFPTDYDQYYCFVSPTGVISSNGVQVLCDAYKNQVTPSITGIGDNAYVIWHDTRSYFMHQDDHLVGLYGAIIPCNASGNIDTEQVPQLLNTVVYPNPLSGSVSIALKGKQAGKQRLQIFNIKGQLVRNLEMNGLPNAQETVFHWDGKDKGARLVPAGVYLYRIKSGTYTTTGKMLKLSQ